MYIQSIKNKMSAQNVYNASLSKPQKEGTYLTTKEMNINSTNNILS